MDKRYAKTLRKQKAKRKEIDKIRKEKSKKSKNNNGKTLVYLLIILFSIIAIAGAIVAIIDTTMPVTDMNLKSDYVYLTQNATNFTISGSTNAGAKVNITSEELNFNQTPIKVDANGKFEYVVKVPKKVGFGKITISALGENKKPNSTIIEFKRTSPKTETNPKTETTNVNIDDGWETVSILYPEIISSSDEMYYEGYAFTFQIKGDSSSRMFVVPDSLYYDKFINYATKDKIKIKYHSGTGKANNGASFPIYIVDDVKEV